MKLIVKSVLITSLTILSISTVLGNTNNNVAISDLAIGESLPILSDSSKDSYLDVVKMQREQNSLKTQEYLFTNYDISESSTTSSEIEYQTYDPKVFDVPALPNQYVTYMPIDAIKSPSSRQYKLVNSGLVHTDEDGFSRINEDYCIALGSYYGNIVGNRYMVEFENGEIITAVLTDAKSDLHTDSNKQYSDINRIFNGKDGNIMEIVFDDSTTNETSYSGKVRTINAIINERFPSHVKSITLIGNYKL